MAEKYCQKHVNSDGGNKHLCLGGTLLCVYMNLKIVKCQADRTVYRDVELTAE